MPNFCDFFHRISVFLPRNFDFLAERDSCNEVYLTSLMASKSQEYHLTYVILYYNKKQSIRHYKNSHHAVFVKTGQPFMLHISKKYDFQVLIFLKLPGRKFKFKYMPYKFSLNHWTDKKYAVH